MKKYSILTLSLVFAGVVCYAQQGVAANKNSTEPTMANGIPYSQYKAEQDALKQQQNNKKAVLPSDVVTINTADAKPAPAKSVIQPSNIKIDEKLPATPAMRPIPKPVPSGITVQTEDLKQQSAQVQTQKPQAPEQLKLPAALKGTSVDPDARPAMPAVKDATVPVKKD